MLRMADAGAFRPLWSQKVIDEAMIALMRIHNEVDSSRFQNRFQSMNNAFDDALVTGWEPLVAGLQDLDLPDPDDAHVIAGALRGRADIIVTENIKHFPESVLDSLGLTAVRTDEFLMDQFDLAPSSAYAVVEGQARAMARPPAEIEQLIDRLERNGARKFAKAIRDMIPQPGDE